VQPTGGVLAVRAERVGQPAPDGEPEHGGRVDGLADGKRWPYAFCLR